MMTPSMLGLTLLSLLDPLGPRANGEESPQEATTLVRYDLRPLLPSFDAGTRWTQSLHRGFDGILGIDPEDVTLDSFHEDASPDAISELVTLVLGDDLHHEGRQVSLDGRTSLMVLAPPPVQKKVSLVLGAFEKAFAAHTRIQLDVLDLEGGDLGQLITSNVLTREEGGALVESLRSGGAAHQQFVLDLSAGKTAVVRQRRVRSYVVDYNVEIAERAIAFDPVALPVHEGIQILLRGVPVRSGTSLSACITDARILQDADHELKLDLVGFIDHDRDGTDPRVEGPRAVQVGRVLTRSLACSTYLDDGTALVFGSTVPGVQAPANQVLVMRRAGGLGSAFRRVDIPDTTRSLLMVNTEVLGKPEFSFVHRPFDPERELHAPQLHARLNTKPTSFLFDWLKYRFSVWRQVGPWAVIVTDPEWDAQAAGELERLMASSRPAVEVVGARVEMGRSAGGGAPFRWSIPVLPGYECGALLGISSTALVDYDVEVAQGASVYDPVVVPTFQGLMTSFAVSQQGESLILDAHGQGLWPIDPERSFDPGGIIAGLLQLPSGEALSFSERRTATPGAPFVFGLSGPGSGASTMLTCSFRFVE